MNELLPFSEKRMTVKEVAGALGVADRTVRDNIARLFPGIARDGVATLLNEEQVTAIKIAIERSGRTDLANVRQVGNATTELEIAVMTAKVLGYWKEKAEELAGQVAVKDKALALAAPKIELAEAVGRSEKNMSITDVSKIFGLHPRTEVFPYLRALGYLTRDDLPTQKAIDAGYLALRVTTDHLGETHSQAVVETWMLENWRAHVVHQVKRWAGEIK
jgi:phage antirepressor YoqD-like protein